MRQRVELQADAAVEGEGVLREDLALEDLGRAEVERDRAAETLVLDLVDAGLAGDVARRPRLEAPLRLRQEEAT